MEVPDVNNLKCLDAENAKLQKPLAEQEMAGATFKEMLAKAFEARIMPPSYDLSHEREALKIRDAPLPWSGLVHGLIVARPNGLPILI